MVATIYGYIQRFYDQAEPHDPDFMGPLTLVHDRGLLIVFVVQEIEC
jgi:hypothetical protein